MLIRKHKPFSGRTLKQKNPKILKKLAIAFAIVLIAFAAYIKVQPHTLEAKQRVKLESTVHQLQQTKQQLIDEQSKSKADDEAKTKQIEELKKEIEKAAKEGEFGKDEEAKYLEELQSLVNTANIELEEMYNKKEKDILGV
jgi:ribosome recycling factor